MHTTSNSLHEAWKAKEAARAVARAQLQAEHPELLPDTGNSLVTAAKNIRRELAAAYPDVKFSIRSRRFSMGDTIDVAWTDGPTNKAVDAIINRYAAGDFDGMTDSYTYSHTAWSDAFGDAKYVHSRRNYSDGVIGLVIAREWKRYRGAELPAPTVEDFRNGRLYTFNRSDAPDVGGIINRALQDQTID